MATLNPFDLLGDDDTEDPTQLIAKLAPVIAAAKAPAPDSGKKGSAQPVKEAVKLPSKPLPPSQAVREARSDAPRGGRGGFRGGSRGRGGGRGFNREITENENSFGNSNGNTGGYRGSQEAETGKTLDRHGSGPRDGFRGGRRGGFNNGDTVEGDGFRGVRRGGFNNGEAAEGDGFHGGRRGYNNGEAAEGERPRRTYERRSGTGRENNFKRDGAGRGNWGTPTDEITPEAKEPVAEADKVVDSEKLTGQEETDVTEKDVNAKETEEKEPEEDKEMTLEEYQKVLEEKRKALLALKPEERKVNLDKELESMQLLDNKKNDEDVSVKLGSEKDKRKDATEKAKKSLSINEFLKPAEGNTNYRPGGRGRGRGQGRGGGNTYSNVKAPSIEDVGQFPSLGGK